MSPVPDIIDIFTVDTSSGAKCKLKSAGCFETEDKITIEYARRHSSQINNKHSHEAHRDLTSLASVFQAALDTSIRELMYCLNSL